MKAIETIISALTDNEKQLLKDTIRYGAWGDCEQEFLSEQKQVCTVPCYGYCTNDAKSGGHFKGREISNMFRSIYRKLCPHNRNQIGEYISHCNDWWGDGSGDMLFVKSPYDEALEAWASNKAIY